MLPITLEPFSDPYRDAASQAIPLTFPKVLRWAEQQWLANRSYAKSVERLIAYFITTIDIGGLEDAEEIKQERALHDKVLSTREAVKLAGIDSACYGSGFLSFVVPFIRTLACRGKRCATTIKLKEAYKSSYFEWKCPNFYSKCPSCGYVGEFRVVDIPNDIDNSLRLKRWSPHEIRLIHNVETGDNRFLWKIPEDYRRMIMRSDCDVFQLERANINVLEAIAKNALFEFHPDTIYQMRQQYLAGIPLRGWGIPHPLLNHRRLYLLQVLHRQQEAIGIDWIVPWRVITPAPRQGSSTAGGMGLEPYMSHDSGNTQRWIRGMIEQRRRDPTAIGVSPTPLQFQVFGGDGTKLAPIDLWKFQQDSLLNDSGPPVELWQGTTKLEAAPIALRLMESDHGGIPSMLNGALSWISKTSAQLRKRKPAEADFRKVTLADDIQRQMLALQLAQGGQLANSLVLRDLGYDYAENQEQMARDAVTAAEAQAKAQELMGEAGMAQQMIRAGAPGTQPPGGPGGAQGGGQGAPQQAAPGGMSPEIAQYMASSGAPQTMADLTAAADAIAQQLAMKTDAERLPVLKQLRQSNEPLHRLVTGQLKKLRDDVRSQAGSQALAQMQQGGR